MALRDYRIAPLNGGAPGHAVVFLHGLGDSGAGGLLEIGRLWSASLPDTEFLCPDAPFAFAGGPIGRQWFDLSDMSLPAMLEGARTAAPYLNDYIDQVLASRKLPAAKLALAGFSQGTIMALYVGLRRAATVAGILGYSGVLVGAEALAFEKKGAPPVMLAHGTLDDVVPYAFQDMSADSLRRAGIAVECVTMPGTGHGIDGIGIKEGLRFLQRIFA